MKNKLMIGVAIGALMVSGALAQSPNAPTSPAATAPAAAQPISGKADFVVSQKPDQWLASKFTGTDVMSADNKKIGDVSDILFDKDGKVEAYVVSVGGFLGMGAKDVALAPSSFDVIPGENGAAAKLKLSLNQDELKQAQNFKAYEPPHPTTTGMAPSGMRPGGMKPTTSTPPTGK
ncbi:MAG: PRC-barrel domain-containing protein [Pseudolabrys sp.]